MRKFLPSLRNKLEHGQKQPHSAEQDLNNIGSKSKKNSALTTVIILVLAPILAIVLTTFVFRSYQVDGQSMVPTLQHNDRLIINKLPRTWAKIAGHAYLPRRGDVIVFTKHDLDQYEGDRADRELIKRVLGLPGERVVVKNGKLTIYNDEYPKGFEPDKTLPYGSNIGATPGNIDLTVPENEVFVCGDNRANSQDSRTFGAIPAKDIVGKLTFRLFPLGEAKKF